MSGSIWGIQRGESDADRIQRHGWDPFVACSFCGDTGICPDTGLECHCLTGMAKSEGRHRRERWESIVPLRFRDYTLAGHPNRKLAAEVGAWVDNRQPGENLLIQGGTGRGKTGAAIAALRELHFTGASVLYWSLPDLMDALRSEEFARKGDGADRREPAMPALLRSDVLLLDDMATERPTDYVKDRLYLIFDGRYTRGLPTIITTNVVGEKWESYLGERIASRINECVRKVGATGTDLRRQGGWS